MVGDAPQRLGKPVIAVVDPLLCRISRLDAKRPGFFGKCPQVCNGVRVFRDGLGDDVLRTLQRSLRRGKAGVGVHVSGRLLERARLRICLGENQICQRLEPRIARLGGAGGPLFPERLVQVFHALHRVRSLDAFLQLGRELALFPDCAQHLLFARGKPA